VRRQRFSVIVLERNDWREAREREARARGADAPASRHCAMWCSGKVSAGGRGSPRAPNTITLTPTNGSEKIGREICKVNFTVRKRVVYFFYVVVYVIEGPTEGDLDREGGHDGDEGQQRGLAARHKEKGDGCCSQKSIVPHQAVVSKFV